MHRTTIVCRLLGLLSILTLTPPAALAAPNEAPPAEAAPPPAAAPADAPSADTSADQGQCDRAQLFGTSTDEHAEPTASWAERIKEPMPGWTWGFDLRLRDTYINNGITLNQKDPNHEWHWQRQRARVWTRIAPVDDFEINLRLAWEGKHFARPRDFENWSPTSAVFDLANVKFSDIADSGVTVQLGRQNLMLGDRWLVMDGTPLVGSTTAYFDAARLTVDLADADTTLDVVYLEQDAEEDDWFDPLCDEEKHILEHDETGFIVWLTNKSLERTQLDGYFIYNRRSPALATGDQAELYTVGTRVEHQFSDRLTARANGAGQFGRKNGVRHCAFGLLSRLSYQCADAWHSALRFDYEYLSGDNPSTQADEGFDVLWGRWPRFSEMIIYTYAGETRIADFTNLHRVSLGWTGHPREKLELCSDYHLLFAAQNPLEGQPGFGGGGFRGQLISGVLKYQFTPQLSGHLLGELFCPGDYYDDDRGDPAAFLRAQLVYSF